MGILKIVLSLDIGEREIIVNENTIIVFTNFYTSRDVINLEITCKSFQDMKKSIWWRNAAKEEMIKYKLDDTFEQKKHALLDWKNVTKYSFSFSFFLFYYFFFFFDSMAIFVSSYFIYFVNFKRYYANEIIQ